MKAQRNGAAPLVDAAVIVSNTQITQYGQTLRGKSSFSSIRSICYGVMPVRVSTLRTALFTPLAGIRRLSSVLRRIRQRNEQSLEM